MCLRVSSSCVSCPIRSCSFWFSSWSCWALCWVSMILLRALSRLFLTAMLFLSRRSRYSALSLLMYRLFAGAFRDGRRNMEKSWRWGKKPNKYMHQSAGWRGLVPAVGCCGSAAGWGCRHWGSWDRRRRKAGRTVPSSAQPPCHRPPPSPVPATGCRESCPCPAGWKVPRGRTEQSGGGPDPGMPTPGWQKTPAFQTSEGSNSRRVSSSYEAMEATTTAPKACTQRQFVQVSSSGTSGEETQRRNKSPRAQSDSGSRREGLLRRLMFDQDVQFQSRPSQKSQTGFSEASQTASQVDTNPQFGTDSQIRAVQNK